MLPASQEASHRRPVRCAIYTRQSVSSSDGLSSCEVQHEACSLYLQSQREDGWTLLPERFDDDGHSAQDNFMLNIMASFGEFERELISARIADSRARLKARRLRFAGGVPFGYDSDERTKQLVPNERSL